MGNTHHHKINIIVSTYDYVNNPFYSGGGAVAIREVFTRLRRNFSVTVVSGKYPGCLDEEVVDNIRHIRVGSRINHPQISQFAYQLTLPFVVHKLKFDLWIESFTPPFSTNFIPLFTKKPVIGLVHMLSGEDMERKYRLPIFRLIESIGLRKYHSFVVTSSKIKQKIARLNPGAQMYVIPNGVNIPRKTTSTDSHRFMLFIGRIENNQKGLDLLVEAMGLVKDTVNTGLVIAGSGSKAQQQSLRKLVIDHKLSSRIKMIGKAEGKSKDRLFRNCSMVIVPSRFETFSIVAMEAMSYGKPIIYFDIDGLDWIPKNVGMKVSRINSRSLSKSISYLDKHPDVRKRLGENGRKYSLNYPWDKVSDMFRSVIYAHVD